MMPTMIAVGLGLGLAADRLGRLLTTATALVAGLAWGLVVGEVLTGTLLGLANLVVGLVVGCGVAILLRSASRRPVA